MIDPRSISARDIAALQDDCTRRWHLTEPSVADGQNVWLQTVAGQHAANFELWHTEDQARLPDASDAQIAVVKRAIDRINQRRNDLAEACDALLLDILAAQNLPAADALLHSESPGLMIDRLSILSLKIFHTAEQMERTDAPAGHVERNRERLAILTGQRADLVECFDRAWAAVLAGSLRFKVYRQLKMYNDPDLNPAIYQAPSQEPGATPSRLKPNP